MNFRDCTTTRHRHCPAFVRGKEESLTLAVPSVRMDGLDGLDKAN